MEITRTNYLMHVFQRLNVSDYRIIQRNNLMQHYPSDFDIVRVCSGFTLGKSNRFRLFQFHSNEQIIDALKNHPLIRSVHPHRQILRYIHYSNSSCFDGLN